VVISEHVLAPQELPGINARLRVPLYITAEG
jgi:hypothetical protein